MAAACEKRALYVLSVTTTPSAWTISSALAKDGNRIRTALGLHPQIAHERHSELDLFDSLVPQTKYVGEIGIDGAPELKAHRAVQLQVFEHILESCRRAGGRIMSIHSRRAASDVLDRIQLNLDAGIPILHWFTGSLRELERAVKLGCWFSVGPAMLKSERGRALAAAMPRDRILTETDGPFAQINGQAVVPWGVVDAINILGELWDMPGFEVEDALGNNLRTLTRNFSEEMLA